MGDILGGATKAKADKARKLQEAEIAKRKQIETARLAVSEDEVARRKAAGAAGRAGRGSLIATSQTGVSGSLGGT
jgi:hypothetical protein